MMLKHTWCTNIAGVIFLGMCLVSSHLYGADEPTSTAPRTSTTAPSQPASHINIEIFVDSTPTSDSYRWNRQFRGITSELYHAMQIGDTLSCRSIGAPRIEVIRITKEPNANASKMRDAWDLLMSPSAGHDRGDIARALAEFSNRSEHNDSLPTLVVVLLSQDVTDRDVRSIWPVAEKLTKQGFHLWFTGPEKTNPLLISGASSGNWQFTPLDWAKPQDWLHSSETQLQPIVVDVPKELTDKVKTLQGSISGLAIQRDKLEQEIARLTSLASQTGQDVAASKGEVAKRRQELDTLRSQIAEYTKRLDDASPIHAKHSQAIATTPAKPNTENDAQSNRPGGSISPQDRPVSEGKSHVPQADAANPSPATDNSKLVVRNTTVQPKVPDHHNGTDEHAAKPPFPIDAKSYSNSVPKLGQVTHPIPLETASKQPEGKPPVERTTPGVTAGTSMTSLRTGTQTPNENTEVLPLERQGSDTALRIGIAAGLFLLAMVGLSIGLATIIKRRESLAMSLVRVPVDPVQEPTTELVPVSSNEVVPLIDGPLQAQPNGTTIEYPALTLDFFGRPHLLTNSVPVVINNNPVDPTENNKIRLRLGDQITVLNVPERKHGPSFVLRDVATQQPHDDEILTAVN